MYLAIAQCYDAVILESLSLSKMQNTKINDTSYIATLNVIIIVNFYMTHE